MKHVNESNGENVEYLTILRVIVIMISFFGLKITVRRKCIYYLRSFTNTNARLEVERAARAEKLRLKELRFYDPMS
jgi:hypothetical protein